MDFLLFLLPAFVLVIVFGYFKYINLLHEKSRQQKEIKQLYKLLNGFDFTIKQFGDTYQMKFQRLVKLNEATGNSSLTPIKPLVNNFSRIMAESIKSQGDTTVIIKKPMNVLSQVHTTRYFAISTITVKRQNRLGAVKG